MPELVLPRRRSLPRVRLRPWAPNAPRAARWVVLRHQLGSGLAWLLWPPLAAVASLRRRTWLSGTPVIAVVGSFGKTTATRAIAVALGQRGGGGHQPNYWSHLALALLRTRRGTPVVVEAGISRRGQMRRYAALLRPTMVVFTGVGSDHREALGSLEEIRDEKAKMLQALPATGLAILNGDDPQVMHAAGSLAARRLSFGIGAGNDVRATIVDSQVTGTALRVEIDGDVLDGQLRLLGEPGARAALAAVAVARELGVAPADALARIAGLEPPHGRLEPVPLPGGATLLCDDCKSGAETIAVAIETLGSLPATRRLIVLGDVTEPGPFQHAVQRELGRDAARVAQGIHYIGSHGKDVRRGAHLGGLPRERFHHHRTVHEIAAALRSELAPGDVVLIKGRESQKLGRVALLLQGEPVTCAIRVCLATGLECRHCPALAAS